MAEKPFMKKLDQTEAKRPKATKPKEELTPEKALLLAQVRECAETCWTAVQIAKKLKISHHYVQKLVRRYKIPLADRDNRILDRIKEEIALNPFRQVTEIAETLELPYMQVYKLIRRHNIPLENVGRRVLLADQVRELAAKGNTQAEIARQLKVSRQRVYEVVKDYGIKVKLHKPSDKQIDMVKYRRALKYFKKGLTRSQTQQRTKFSPTTIQVYFDRWQREEADKLRKGEEHE